MYRIPQFLLGLTGTVLGSFIACNGSEAVSSQAMARDAAVDTDVDAAVPPAADSAAAGHPSTQVAVAPEFRTIPYSLIQAVDDIGWRYYDNNTVNHKTHRQIEASDTFITEEAKLSYYQDMADIGKRAGTRLHAVAILQDWDYDNTIVTKSKYNGYDRLNDGTQSAHKMWMNPSPKPMSKALTESIARLMLDNAAFVEFGMHGVSHEHYTDVHDNGIFDGGGGFARAEFAYLANDDAVDPVQPTWGWDNGVKHMDCFKEIYERFFPPPTHSFVKSFVAPAHGYYYNQDKPKDLTRTTSDLLRKYGIKYADNDKRVVFSEAVRKAQVANPILRGVSFLDRPFGTNWSWHGEVPWYGEYTDTPYPRFPDRNYGAIEAHFPNLWDAVDIWVNYLKEVNHDQDRYLARNTVQNHSQYYYNHQAAIRSMPVQTLEVDMAGNIVEVKDVAYEIDTRNISDDAYASDILGTLVLKAPLNGKHISSAKIDRDAQIIGTWEDDFGYGYLVIGSSNPMGRLSKGLYRLVARLGNTYMQDTVDFHQGTFNVLSREKDSSGLRLTVEMYGTQELRVRRDRAPESAISNKPTALKINTATWDAAKGEYILNITATDIQGVTGVITIR